MKEPKGISNQEPKENQDLTSKVLKEIVDAPFENFHEHYFQGSCKKQFDSVQAGLQFEQPYWGKKMIEKFEYFHGFYDLVAEYMENLCHGRYIIENFAGCHDQVAKYVENICSGNGWLCLYSKNQSIYHNLFPLSSSSLFFIKDEEKVCLWDHLFDWLQWKSEVTWLGIDAQ